MEQDFVPSWAASTLEWHCFYRS